MFDGRTFDAEQDESRLASQLLAVRTLMVDGVWRSLSEIEGTLGYPQASVSARLRDLRKPKFGGYRVEGRRRKQGGGTWEYRVLPPLDRIPDLE